MSALKKISLTRLLKRISIARCGWRSFIPAIQTNFFGFFNLIGGKIERMSEYMDSELFCMSCLPHDCFFFNFGYFGLTFHSVSFRIYMVSILNGLLMPHNIVAKKQQQLKRWKKQTNTNKPNRRGNQNSGKIQTSWQHCCSLQHQCQSNVSCQRVCVSVSVHILYNIITAFIELSPSEMLIWINRREIEFQKYDILL